MSAILQPLIENGRLWRGQGTAPRRDALPTGFDALDGNRPPRSLLTTTNMSTVPSGSVFVHLNGIPTLQVPTLPEKVTVVVLTSE